MEQDIGCEVASAVSRMGSEMRIGILTQKANRKIVLHPAIGGLAKGNLVREIDALGGVIGRE